MKKYKISNAGAITSKMVGNVIEESITKQLIFPSDSNVYQQMLYGMIGSRLCCDLHILRKFNLSGLWILNFKGSDIIEPYNL